MQIMNSIEDVKQNKVVKLYPDENHSNFLRAELRHMFENENYLDTELHCSDKRILRVNKLIAALAFPELSSSASYGNHRAEQTVLLPDSTFENVKRIIDGLLSEGTGRSHFDVSQVKHEEIEVQSPESIDQRSFDNLEDCSEDNFDNDSENKDILLEDFVLKQPEEKKVYKQRSLTWKYFTKSKNSENIDIGECNECFAEIKTASGNTSGLKTHLRANHKSLYEELVKNNSAKAKEVIETIDKRSFNNFEDCSKNYAENESQSNDYFLEDCVPKHSEEKKGYKVRSLTWNYFTKSKNAENVDIGKCNQCSAEIKTASGNTSGLKTHLKSNHKTLYKEFVQNNSARANRISNNCVKDDDKIRYRSSGRAYVWEYFSKNVTGPSKGPSGTCKMCQKVIKTPTCSTSGLIKHLEAMHLEIFQEICYKCKTGLDLNHPNLQCSECQCRFHEDCPVFLDKDSWVCAVCDQRKVDIMARKTQDAKQKLKLKKLCPECGNAYRNLQQHIKKIHQGIKYHQPSECDICKKMFSTKSHLKTHVKTVHNGEKNYCCKFCERAFSVKSQLKRHLLCMHQGYKINQNSVCPDCGRRFRLKASMSKHRRVVHLGIKKSDNAVCDECGQNFTQRGTLYLHLRKVHGKEPAVINQNMVGKMTAQNSYVDPSLILEAYPDIDMDLSNQSICVFHKEGCQQ